MSSVKVVIGFYRMRDEELNTRAQSIVEKMTGNPHYPDPVPALADITPVLTAYGQALVQAQNGNGGKDKTAFKNAKRVELVTLLTRLAQYVQVTCQNDLTILLTSGFDSRKPNTPIGMLEKPTGFELTSGPNPGSITLNVSKVSGANTYTFEYAATPVNDATQWVARGIKGRTHIIDGLTRGQEYAFRVAGIGADPVLVYSEVISRFVH